jgi:hypothetical protein
MQRTGRPPSPDSRAKYLATREAIAPPKQLELIEKRSSWVFATVGTIGAALGGFTLLTGSRPIIEATPILAVIVLCLVSLAILLAGYNLISWPRMTEGVSGAMVTFEKLARWRARRASIAVGLLLVSVAVAAIAGFEATSDQDNIELRLAWKSAESSGGTVTLGAKIDDLEPDDQVKVSLIARTEAGDETVLFTGIVGADDYGKASLADATVNPTADVRTIS